MIPLHHISGWYPEEEWGSGKTQWMAKDAIIEVECEKRSTIIFRILSFHRSNDLIILINRKPVKQLSIPTNFIKIQLYLNIGKNEIVFCSNRTLRPCSIPELNSSDQRRLSFAFQDLQIKEIQDFEYSKYPLKLNLGCGFDKRNGYLNIDFQAFHKPDLVADIRSLGMLPSGKYEEVMAQDVLEHLHQVDVIPALDEWHRLLMPNGILKLRIPNLAGILKLFESRSDHENLLPLLFGTQAYNGDYHLTGFTKELIAHYLNSCGFKDIIIMEKDVWLLEINSKKAQAKNLVK